MLPLIDFTLMLVSDCKMHVFAICVQGVGEELNGGLFSRESTRDSTLFLHSFTFAEM